MERLSDYHRWPRAELFAKTALAVAQREPQTDTNRAFGHEIARLMDCATDGFTARQRVEKTANPLSLSTAPWSDWATAAREFLDITYDRSVVGRLPAAHRIGFRVASLAPGGDAVAAWVADGAAKPVCEMTPDRIVLDPKTVAAIAVLTQDMLEASPVDAERMMLGALVRACVLALDTVFVSADAASTATPAGILNAASAVSSTGSTASAIAADMAAMIEIPNSAHVGLDGACWFGSHAAHAFLRLLGVANPDGTVGNFPFLASDSAVGKLALVCSQYIVVGGDDTATLTNSSHAMLDLTGGDAPNFDVWGRNCLAVRSEIFSSWALLGPVDSNGDSLAVVELTGASWT